MAGVFAANPLSLTVPDPTFESWLRDTGYLEVLDERSSTSPTFASSPFSSSAAASQPRRGSITLDSVLSDSNAEAACSTPACMRGDARSGLRGALSCVGGSAIVGVVRTLLAIATTNPIAKLATEDFSGSTPPWTAGFLTSGGGGQASSYSWPAGPEQARMRIHENVKRYARNYACLWLIFFACTLYKMPLALLGLVSSLAIWEALRIGSSWWDLEQKYPGLRFVLVRVAQLATPIVLYYCKFQVAVLCAISFSYGVVILHASLRKLMSPKQPAGTKRHKRSHPNK